MFVMHHHPLVPRPPCPSSRPQGFEMDLFLHPEGYKAVRPFKTNTRERTYLFLLLPLEFTSHSLLALLLQTRVTLDGSFNLFLHPLDTLAHCLQNKISFTSHFLVSKEGLQRGSRKHTLGQHRPDAQHESAPGNLLRAP